MINNKMIIAIFTVMLCFVLNITVNAAVYDYDNLGRIIKVHYNSGKIVHYTYDDNGNITETDYEGNNTIIPSPININAEKVTNKKVILTWEQPKSSNNIVEYKVYRNGELLETVAETRYEDSGLCAETHYSYHIVAVNSMGAESVMSSVFNVTTLFDCFENEDFIQVSGGGFHSIALKNDGTVWAWGNNDYGQLGTGNNVESYIPQKVQGLEHIIEISTRGDHNMALKDDGTVWTWGLNNYGQLGIGNLENVNIPVKIGGLSNIKTISAGHLFSLAVNDNGEVYSWGICKNGQLGINSFYAFFATPQKIKTLENIRQVSAGHYHALAVDNDGNAWAWGKNSFGQLGDGTTNNSANPIKVCEGILSVCAGFDNSFFAIDNTGGDCYAPILVCGYNGDGQLGVGNNQPVYKLTEATTINELGVSGECLHDLRNISSNTAALMYDGGVHMAGMNYYGQFGNGKNRYRICQLAFQFYNIDENKVDSVSAGSGHSLILANGKIYCSGLNNHGQCGVNTNGQNINVFMPVSE